MRKKLTFLSRVLFSALLLVLVFWFMREDIRDIPGALADVDLFFIGAALLSCLVSMVFLAYRLKLLLYGEDLMVPMWKMIELTFVGHFFNNFMPTAIGGDIVKAHYVSRICGVKMRSYASVVMDRFIGFYTFLIIGFMAVFMSGTWLEGLPAKPIMLSLFLVGVILFLTVASRRIGKPLQKFLLRLRVLGIGEKLSELHRIAQGYRERRLLVLEAFLISVLAQLSYFLIVHVLFLGMKVDVQIEQTLLIMPVVVLVSMMPSVGGLGFREGAIIAFFAPIAGRGPALAVGLLFLACYHLFVTVIGGCVYFLWNLKGLGEGIRDTALEGGGDLRAVSGKENEEV